MQVENLGQIWESLTLGMRLPIGDSSGVLHALHNPVIAQACAILLLLLAFTGSVWFVARRIWPAHRMIQMASRAVEGTADQVAFTASFPRFDRAINEIALLRRPWAQFRVGIIIPPQSARAPVRHHLRAGDYLTLEALEAGGFKFSFFKNWAGFFLGAGILISVLAITLDVHLSSLAFASDPSAWNAFTNRLSSNLTPLLAGMGSGLTLALVFYWAAQRLKSDLLQLSQVLEDRIKFSVARPAPEQYAQLTGTVGGAAADQSVEPSVLPEQFRAMSAEIIAALSRVETQMTETLPSRIGDAMAPLSEALDLLGRRLSETNAEALRQAVGELSQGLHARAVEDLDALSAALAQARSGLEDAGHSLRDAGVQMSASLSNAGEALAEQMKRAGQSAQEALTPLPQRTAEFDAVMERFNQGLSRHENAISSVTSTAHRALELMDEILARPRDMTATPLNAASVYAPAAQPQSQPLIDLMAVEDFSRTARDLTASLEAVQDARRCLKRLSNSLHQPATSLIAEDWAQRREMLSDPDDMLNEVLENFRVSATQQRVGLDAAVEELETRLERLFRDLDAGAARLDGALHSVRRQAMIASIPQAPLPQADAPGANEDTNAA